MSNLLHLYRRAGFGLSPAEWQNRRNWTTGRAVDDLFMRAKKPIPLPEGDNPDYTNDGMMAALNRLKDADLIHQLGFRRCCASVIDDWLEGDSFAVLGERFKGMGVF